MSEIKVAIAGFFLGVLISVAIFWCSGFDFDERGSLAVYCFLLSLLTGALMAFIAFGVHLMISDMAKNK